MTSIAQMNAHVSRHACADRFILGMNLHLARSRITVEGTIKSVRAVDIDGVLCICEERQRELLMESVARLYRVGRGLHSVTRGHLTQVHVEGSTRCLLSMHLIPRRHDQVKHGPVRAHPAFRV